jgi:hypothetical protein
MKMLLWVAGGLQLVVAAANLPAKRVLSLDAELSKLSPILRQIYRVQHAYIVGLLVVLGGLSIGQASTLVLGGPLALFLAVFWGGRLAVQRLYYDPLVLRRHRAADVAFTLVFAYLTTVYALSSAGALR